jgi:hypothetical protein
VSLSVLGVCIGVTALSLYVWLEVRQRRAHRELTRRLVAQERVIRGMVERDALGPVLARLSAVLEELESR